MKPAAQATTPPTISTETAHITHLEVTKDRLVSVGVDGVEKIEPYNEPGGLGPVLAFAVYVGGTVVSRYNWLQCSAVHYAPGSTSIQRRSGDTAAG